MTESIWQKKLRRFTLIEFPEAPNSLNCIIKYLDEENNFSFPVAVAPAPFGNTIEVPIANSDRESKSRSMQAVQILAQSVGAECVVAVGEAWAREVDESEVREVVQFNFQSLGSVARQLSGYGSQPAH